MYHLIISIVNKCKITSLRSSILNRYSLMTYDKHKEPNEIRCDLIERLEDYCRNMNKEDIISGLVNELTTDQCLSCMDNLERDIF